MIDKINEQVRRSATSISIHKFKILKNKSFYAFLFVEGEDDRYFYPQNAKNYFADKTILPLECAGKNGVIEVNDILKDEISENIIVGFFVDRDFDNEVNESISDTIYITPAYSVENLVYNQETFKNLLLGKFGLFPSDESFDRCLGLYEQLSHDYYNSIQLYNSWIYAQRNLVKGDKKLNLPKNLPADFVELKACSITCNYDLKRIEEVHPNAPKVTYKNIDLALENLSQEKPEYTYRGKFNWQFFAHIISLLIEDANSPDKRLYIDKSVKFNVTKSDSRKFFEEISNFSRPPMCLLNYFEKIAA